MRLWQTERGGAVRDGRWCRPVRFPPLPVRGFDGGIGGLLGEGGVVGVMGDGGWYGRDAGTAL